MADDKGKFSTNISQAHIDAAMASVEKARTKPEVEIEIEREGEGGGADPAEVEALRAEASALMGEVEGLRKENEALKEQLEFSQTKGRETLEKLKEEHDRVLRAAADLDNQKKRAQREKEEAMKFGLEKFLKELLPVADNLDRALSHAATSDKDALLQGVKMVAKLLEDILGKHAVKAFSAQGLAFDPRLHEAMQQVDVDGPSNMVHEEFLRGYTLNERLIRPALVSVTRQRAQPAAAASTPAADPTTTTTAPSTNSASAEPSKTDANGTGTSSNEDTKSDSQKN